eukprot:6187171-Prymnesium_polylepis.2
MWPSPSPHSAPPTAGKPRACRSAAGAPRRRGACATRRVPTTCETRRPPRYDAGWSPHAAAVRGPARRRRPRPPICGRLRACRGAAAVRRGRAAGGSSRDSPTRALRRRTPSAADSARRAASACARRRRAR